MNSYRIDSKNFVTRLALTVAALALAACSGGATPTPPAPHAPVITDYEVTLHLQRLGLERL